MAYCTICRTGIVWIRDEDGIPLPIEIQPSPNGDITLLTNADGEYAVKIERDSDTLRIVKAYGIDLFNNHKDICLEAKFDGT